MRTQIDWENAPEGARWWAMDADGNAHWYMEPNIIPGADFWIAEEKEAPTFGYTGDWGESLTERPR